MTPSINPLRASPQNLILKNLQTLSYWWHRCKIEKWSSWSRCGLTCTCTLLVNAATVLYFRAESWWHWPQDFKPPVARRHFFLWTTLHFRMLTWWPQQPAAPYKLDHNSLGPICWGHCPPHKQPFISPSSAQMPVVGLFTHRSRWPPAAGRRVGNKEHLNVANLKPAAGVGCKHSDTHACTEM